MEVAIAGRKVRLCWTYVQSIEHASAAKIAQAMLCDQKVASRNMKG